MDIHVHSAEVARGLQSQGRGVKSVLVELTRCSTVALQLPGCGGPLVAAFGAYCMCMVRISTPKGLTLCCATSRAFRLLAIRIRNVLSELSSRSESTN